MNRINGRPVACDVDGCCLLLRSIGHTLEKVDRATGPELAAAIDDAWTVWKARRDEDAVFWFVEDA